MPFPRLSDDLQSVELDLHGATVRVARQMIRRLIALASGRGRATVRIIHGISTSETLDDRPTIRGELLTMLDDGIFDPHVVDWYTFEGTTTISMQASHRPDRTRIQLADLM